MSSPGKCVLEVDEKRPHVDGAQMAYLKGACRIERLIEDDDARFDVRAVRRDPHCRWVAARAPKFRLWVEVADTVALREFGHQRQRVCRDSRGCVPGMIGTRASIESPLRSP